MYDVGCTQMIKRTWGIYLVDNNLRPYEEDVGIVVIHLDLEEEYAEHKFKVELILRWNYA